MKKLLTVFVVLIVVLISAKELSNNKPNHERVKIEELKGNECGDESELRNLFDQKLSNVQVTVCGEVIKILDDDNKGSRHQRFIIRLSTGQTLLIAHNIDIAPRIDGIRVGSGIRVYGEYEWNEKGGVIHWTHRDPDGRHQDGWIEFNGKAYK